MIRYEVVREGLELERGAKLTLDRSGLTYGALCLFQVNTLLIVGRWFPGLIVQPGRWIDTGRAAVHILGLIIRSTT